MNKMINNHIQRAALNHSSPRTRGFLGCLLACAVGCGGAGGEFDPPDCSDDCNEDEVQSGVFVGPVSGLTYETATQEGVTDEEGRFHFAPGEAVTFRIGDAVLGETKGKAEVSPFDLVEGAEIITDGDEVEDIVDEFRVTPLEMVMNITTLLHTLDYDGDAENGIEIRDEVASLFDGTTINLAQKWKRFRTDSGFRGALNQANDAQLFGETRPVAKRSFAMDHLYRTLGVELIKTRWVTEVEYDDDGTIQDEWAQEFDEFGRRVRQKWVFGTDLHEYDDHGNMVRKEKVDSRFTEYLATYHYDDHGNRIRSERVDEDGSESVTYYTYDEHGKVVRKERVEDGNTETITTYSYNAHGHTRRDEYHEDDGTFAGEEVETSQYDKRIGTSYYDALGNLQYAETDSYNERGRGTGEEIDIDGNGSIDYVWRTTYDEHGNKIRTEADGNEDEGGADGTFDDYVATYTYDEHGNKIRTEVDGDYQDGGADGEIDTYTVYSNNYESGRLVGVSSKRFVSGEVRPVSYATKNYDDEGRLTYRSWIREGETPDDLDGTRTYYTYDEDGVLVRRERQTYQDGTIKEVQTYRNVGWFY